MTKDEIINLARRAGFSVDVSNDPNNPPYWWSAGHNDRFEAFAKLVAQHELQACVKAIEDQIAWNLDDPESTAIKAIRTKAQS